MKNEQHAQLGEAGFQGRSAHSLLGVQPLYFGAPTLFSLHISRVGRTEKSVQENQNVTLTKSNILESDAS